MQVVLKHCFIPAAKSSPRVTQRALLYNCCTFLVPYNMPTTNPTAAAPITPYTLPLPTLSAAPPVKTGELTRVFVPIVPMAMAVWLPWNLVDSVAITLAGSVATGSLVNMELSGTKVVRVGYFVLIGDTK